MAGNRDKNRRPPLSRDGWHGQAYEGVESLSNFDSREELEVRKMFIRRQDGWLDEGRLEYMRIHSEEEIGAMLESCGYEVCSIENGFSGDDERDALHGTRVIVARKHGGPVCRW